LGFTRKQRIFVDEYLKTWNAANSARKAGYSENSIYEIASRLLTNVNIKAEIDKRLENSRMGSDEVLQEFADIARSDMGDFVDKNLCIDLADARKRGLTKLIKKIKQKTVTMIGKKEDSEDKEITDIEIELYPRDKALEMLGKYHGLFKENLDITSGGEKITVTLIKDNSGS
jgi:phage terminase small subunit